MTDNIIQKIKDAVIPEIRMIPGVAAAYLFGSYVSGRMTGRSDVDIAILFSDNYRGDVDRLDLMVRLSAAAGKDADIVILNDAAPFLYHEILSNGELIFENNREFRIQGEVKNRRLYEDYLHIHSMYMNGMRKRLV